MDEKEKLKKTIFLLCDIMDEIELNETEQELMNTAIKCVTEKLYSIDSNLFSDYHSVRGEIQ